MWIGTIYHTTQAQDYSEYATVRTSFGEEGVTVGWLLHFPDGWYLLPYPAAPDIVQARAIAGPIETFEAACAAAHLVTWPEYQ